MTQIEYFLIAGCDTILVEVNLGSNGEKYVKAGRKILKKISRNELRRPDGMATLLSGSYAYNYIHGCEIEDEISSLESLIFLCVTEALPYAATPSQTRESSYRFLTSIRSSFIDEFKDDINILCNSNNDVMIDNELKLELHRFNLFIKDKMMSSQSNKNNNNLNINNENNSENNNTLEDLTTGPPKSLNKVKINEIISNVEQVKESVQDSLDMVIDRGEKLPLLHKKALEVNEESIKFKVQSKKIKNRYCKQLYQHRFTMVIIVVIVLYLISAMICGWSWDSC